MTQPPPPPPPPGTVRRVPRPAQNAPAPRLPDPEPVRLTGTLAVLTDPAPDPAAEDTSFTKVRNTAGAAGKPVTIAVLDTGVHASSAYLKARFAAAGDFSAELADPFAYRPDDIIDLHGTKVAVLAASGSDQIRIVDVRVQRVAMSGADNSSSIAKGIAWAIDTQHARIVTCSVDVDWSKPAVQQEIARRPDVLFLTSAGNNDAIMNTRKIDGAEAKPRPNALLVGGVTLDGKRHPSRGAGPGVDVMVPSGSAVDTDRELSVPLPVAAAKLELQQKGAKAAFDAETIAAYEKKGIDHVVGTESGVSFGIPLIANIAAKMWLISPTLTAAEIAGILRDRAVRDTGGVLAGLSKSNGMIDSDAAYRIAAEHRASAAK